MWKEFREFALRGNVVDMAVGIIVGAAFSTLIKSLVSDLLMPPIGLLLGGVDFNNLFWLLKMGDPAGPYLSLADAQAAGAVTINYGVFLDNVVSFLIVSGVMFFMIRGINRLQGQKEEQPASEEAATKECPFCLSVIPAGAVRCPHCTSNLSE